MNAPENQPPPVAANKCLNPSCVRVSAYRGLCVSCYGAARRLVKKNMVTWEALVSAGKATATAYKARPTTVNWLLSANKNEVSK